MPCPVKADIPLFCQFYCLFSFSLFWVPHLWQEPERKAALPIEPSGENEDAITLLVRMPDSSRHGRRFLKSDKLKVKFVSLNSQVISEVINFYVFKLP